MKKVIISFDDFNDSLNNKTLGDLFETNFEEQVILKHPKELDRRSGYFEFMVNYIQKSMSKKLNLKGDDIANELFYVENNNFYYNKSLVLSCEISEDFNDKIYTYTYYKLKV